MVKQKQPYVKRTKKNEQKRRAQEIHIDAKTHRFTNRYID